MTQLELVRCDCGEPATKHLTLDGCTTHSYCAACFRFVLHFEWEVVV